jgi:hypothetical protein
VRRWILLNEDDVRLAHDAQEKPEEAQALSQDLDSGKSQEVAARGATAGTLVVPREKMPADVVVVLNGGFEGASGILDHVDLGESRRERQGVVLHARTASHVPSTTTLTWILCSPDIRRRSIIA